MLNKLSDKIELSSYESKQSYKKILKKRLAISLQIKTHYVSRFSTFDLQVPTFFLKKQHINDLNFEWQIPKTFYIPKYHTELELCNGFNKYARLIFTNIFDKDYDCLFAYGKVYSQWTNFTKIDSFAKEKLTITFLADKNAVNAQLSREVNYFLKLIHEMVYPKKKVNEVIVQNWILEKEYFDLFFNNKNSFYNEIFYFFQNTEVLVLKNTRSSLPVYASFLFKKDVVDTKHTYSIFVLNKPNNSILKIANIFYAPNNKTIKEQFSNISDKSKIGNPYYNLIVNKKLENVIQIEINLTNLFMYLTKSYYVAEVTPTAWNEDLYKKFQKYEIKNF